MMLYEQIKQDILSGLFKEGVKISSEHTLSEQYKMSRQTVRQALAILEQNGYIERRQGSGTYVSERKEKRGRAWSARVITTHISEYIFPSILRGIEKGLSESGYSTVICATHNRVDFERRILEECDEKEFDGLIVEATKSALPNPNIAFYEKLREQGIPVVFFNGHYPVLTDSVFVEMDDKGGGEKAAKYLIDRGHTKIGGIFKSDDIQGIKRYSGYMEALLNENLEINDGRVTWFNSENRQEMFSAETDRILKPFEDCTGIVCYNDEIAVKLIGILARGGYSVPGDKEIVSFDKSLYSEVSTVKIPSLAHPKEILGAIAARKLIEKIEGHPAQSVTLDWGEL